MVVNVDEGGMGNRGEEVGVGDGGGAGGVAAGVGGEGGVGIGGVAGVGASGGGGGGGRGEEESADHGDARGEMEGEELAFVEELIGGADVGGGFAGREGDCEFEVGGGGGGVGGGRRESVGSVSVVVGSFFAVTHCFEIW